MCLLAEESIRFDSVLLYSPAGAAEPDCWTARQIGTSLDYSMGAPVATALTAGLNSQGMHHALPTISMAHFPAMYSEYEVIVRKHGVTPRQSRDLGTAVTEMFRYVFDLNDPAGVTASPAEPRRERGNAEVNSE